MKQLSKSIELAGRTLTFRIGEVAEQATAAVITQYGETTILTTVVVGAESDKDYFPLNVEYVEKLYAGGRIKGSRWVKREGRPNDSAVLAGRLIDRSVRPLFDSRFRNDVQVINTVLSIDGVNSPEIVAALSTSAALSLCSIPWSGPIATLQVGYIEGEGKAGHYVVNPTPDEEGLSKLNLVISSTAKKVVMIECDAEEASDKLAYEGIVHARKEAAVLVKFFEDLRKEVGVKPFVWTTEDESVKLVADIVKKHKKALIALLEEMAQKESGRSGGSDVEKLIMEEFELDDKALAKVMPTIFKKLVKELAFNEDRRIDGRGFDEVRALSAKVGVLPRLHGSALFSRGATQVLSIATLGPLSLQQYLENPEGEFTKRYMHHYYMPPYSVGETGRVGFLNRREIGHGALAEKAVEVMLPQPEEFPYAIRVVSEVLSSNGSTSMASTCGSSLALMDAGVPIKKAVAGIAVGIVYESDEKYKLLTDIIGLEDFFGHMDFKVAGTVNGITAIQLDVKNDGLTDKMIEEVFERATRARAKVLDVMNKALNAPRKEMSKYAPRVIMLTPPPEKIGEIIGPGGKNIKKLIAETGCEIDISDDGKVSISGVDPVKVQMAVDRVNSVSKVYQVGEVHHGVVAKVLAFGGVVEIAPGKDGLLHVSRMNMGFVKDANEVLTVGQEVDVTVEEIDERGRMKFGLAKKDK